MAHPKGRRGLGPSEVLTVRLSKEVADKIRGNHPNICEYLREFIEFHHTRSHKGKGVLKAKYNQEGGTRE